MENPDKPTSDNSQQLRPGAELKARREAGGHSLEQVSADTRITVSRLAALEEDDYARVGAVPFVIGYIRKYAQWLRLDADPLVRAYEEAIGQEPRPQVPAPGAAPEQPSSSAAARKSLPLLWLIIGLVMIWAAVTWLAKDDAEEAPTQRPSPAEPEPTEQAGQPAEPAESLEQFPAVENPGALAESENTPPPAEVRPVPDQPDVEPVEPASVLPTELAAEAEAPAAAPDELALSFAGECWVEIRDAEGNLLVARLQQEGDNLRLSGQAPFTVLLGNARVATLAVNGRQIDTNPGPNRDTMRLRVGP